MILSRFIVLTLLIAVSVPASANEFYWKYFNLSSAFPPKSTPSAACETGTPGGMTFDRAELVSPTQALCFYTQTSTGNEFQVYSAVRGGSECPAGHNYNDVTGECEPPDQTDCEARAGQEISFSRTGKAPDAFLVVIGSNYANSTLACNSGCQISVPEPKCIVKVSGEYTCAGNATIMPIECPVEGGGDGFVEEAAPDVLTPPEPQITEEQEPCLYTRQPDGTWSCRSSESIEADGVSCGTANGQTVCNPSQPSKDQTTINTTVTTTTNPDGSSQTTQTDQSTYVTCVGAKCNSSSSTTTTNTNKDPSGNTINSSTSCTGANCMGNNPNGGEDGTGGGGGTGKCLVNCSPEGEDGGGDFTGGELGEVATIGDATGQFMERVSDAPLMQAVAGISLRGGGSCSFASVSTDIGVIGLDFICQNSNWLDPLYYVFLAIWGLAAVRVLMSA